MSKQREALEMVLAVGYTSTKSPTYKIIKEALAEPDPVLIEREACAKICDTYRDNWYTGRGRYEFMAEGAEYCGDAIRKRGEHEQEPSRKPLTDEQIDAEFDRECWVTVVFADGARGIALDKVTARDFARAIERAHGIGD